jgi:hypothetical protein
MERNHRTVYLVISWRSIFIPGTFEFALPEDNQSMAMGSCTRLVLLRRAAFLGVLFLIYDMLNESVTRVTCIPPPGGRF